MTQTNKKGFTIVEMLMVIGVLAILMGIVTTAASAAIKQARSRRMVAGQGVIQAGIATYRSQYDAWPPENGQLDKWSSNGISGKSNNGVDSGRHIAFLSADQYDEMMYELANCGRFGEELAEEALRRSGNSALLRTAEAIRFDFQADVLEPLLKAAEKESTFKTHVRSLIERGVLDVDDMTVVVLGAPV